MNRKLRRELIKQRLKEELESSEKPLSQIAKEVGINPALLSQYRNSRKLPSIETLSKICEVLGADANYILCVSN